VSAAASAVWSLCATSGARRLAQRAVFLASLFLLILATSDPTLVQAAEAPDAALKASQGHAALVRGQYQEADGLLTEALQSAALAEPTRVFSLNNRGLARWRLRHLRTAVGDFNTALELAPAEPTLYNNRGNVLLELKLYDEAEKDFGQAIVLAPAYGAAHHNRGNALFLLGKHAEAIAEFTKAVTLLPQNPAPLNGRGKAQAALQRPAGAIRDFNRAIALNDRYGEAYGNRAEAMATLHRYREALDDYTSAISFGAKTTRIYLGRASVYRRLNKPGLALEDIAEARSLHGSLAAAGIEPGPEDDAEPHAVETAAAATTDGLCDDARAAQGTIHNLPNLADATRAGLKNTLFFQAKSEVSVAVAPPDSVKTPARRSSPCDPEEAAADDDEEARFIGPEVEDWAVEVTPHGYLARHLEHSAIKLTLEMYGSGEPELLHWQRLKGSLRAIGLLHYYAGTSPKGERLEYVALINVYSGKLIAIEPCRWGDQLASWRWSDTTVVVVDPQGVPSEVKVAEQAEPAARARPPKARRAKRVFPQPDWRAKRPRPRFNPYGRRFDPYGFRSWAYR
jgi:tetratricopeptide (TPR) repeat protein